MFSDQMGAADMLTKALTFTQGEKRLVTTAIFVWGMKYVAVV